MGVVIAECGEGSCSSFGFFGLGNSGTYVKTKRTPVCSKRGSHLQIFCRIHCKPKIHGREFSLI